MFQRQRQRVLILRPDNIGDAVLFSGALKSLRRRWPDARIDLALQPHVRNLFDLCPYVDRVVSTNRLFPWRLLKGSKIRGAWKLAELLREERFPSFWYPSYDTVICPVSGLTEEILGVIRRIRAQEKLGYTGARLNLEPRMAEENRPEAVFTGGFRLAPDDHWIQELPRTRAFLQSCGIEADDLSPEFWLSADDEKFGESTIPGGVLGLFPGSTSKFRLWPVEKWQDLLNRQTLSKTIVAFGSAQDDPMIEGILSVCPDVGFECLNLAGKTTLRQLVACIKRCSALVSMETSGLHVAVACGIPAVALMGGHHFGRYYPWGDPAAHRTAQVDMECFPCRKECKYGDYRCVPGIPVDTVLEELGAATIRQGS
ncbi:MAG: glycosyltransferase family 9 protein [Kiritimatiellia bacterium]|nr:glycosyltransferase family 9 protein [Kiritimatiellia bacterium]